MPDTPREHWDQVYAGKPTSSVSWFQSEPSLSLSMIAAAGVGPDDAIIDVGGGASNLVDRLLDQGYRRLSVLDISSEALAVSRQRLGDRAQAVTWLAETIVSWSPLAGAFDLWHDRAVFHFLVDDSDRQAYLRALNHGLRSGGRLVLGTFALTGPQRCSGLPVRRYSTAALQDALGPGFELVRSEPETHLTPSGAPQDFNWRLFRKTGDSERG